MAPGPVERSSTIVHETKSLGTLDGAEARLSRDRVGGRLVVLLVR